VTARGRIGGYVPVCCVQAHNSYGCQQADKRARWLGLGGLLIGETPNGDILSVRFEPKRRAEGRKPLPTRRCRRVGELAFPAWRDRGVVGSGMKVIHGLHGARGKVIHRRLRRAAPGAPFAASGLLRTSYKGWGEAERGRRTLRAGLRYGRRFRSPQVRKEPADPTLHASRLTPRPWRSLPAGLAAGHASPRLPLQRPRSGFH